MQGRQYDGAGNMRNWWRNDTLLAYKERIKCIETEYSNLTTDTGEHINGLQTLGENIADNGGLKAAFRAFTSLKEEDRTWSRGRLPGLNLTENQLFFLSFAQVRNSRNPGRNCNNGFLIYLLSNIHRVSGLVRPVHPRVRAPLRAGGRAQPAAAARARHPLQLAELRAGVPVRARHQDELPQPRATLSSLVIQIFLS